MRRPSDTGLARRLCRPLASVLLAPLVLSACATLPNGHRWGEDVTASPGWRRVGQAALQSVEKPSFWVPLAAAGAMQIDNWDHRVSRWARRRTPVFGSKISAADWSTYLRSASVVAGWASILLAPSGRLDEDWWLDKLKGSAVDIAGAETAIEFTSGLQRLARRGRPTGYIYPGDTSMPSDHTATAAVYSAIAARNVQLSGVSTAVRTAADFSLGALTVATGWARIEAGAHFPSDTMVGGAIGDFFANFFTAAFLAPVNTPARRITFAALPGGAELAMQLSY